MYDKFERFLDETEVEKEGKSLIADIEKMNNQLNYNVPHSISSLYQSLIDENHWSKEMNEGLKVVKDQLTRYIKSGLN